MEYYRCYPLEVRVVLHACLIALLVYVSHISPCEAQTTPDVLNASDTIAEVVVTARKRSESVVDVPESVSVITASDLERLQVQTFADYASKVPNLSYSYGTGATHGIIDSSSIAIRGIAGSNTVAVYLDDTPLNQAMNPRVVDLARVEVLKGPQGTLFGADSMGGSVRLITQQPSLDSTDFKTALQGGRTSGGGSDDYGGQAIANLSIVPDVFGVRAVLYHYHDSGFLSRAFPNDSNSGVESANEIVNDQGATFTSGISIAGLLKITSKFDATLRLMYQDISLNGWPAALAPLPSFEPIYTSRFQPVNLQDTASSHWSLPSITVAYHDEKWSITSSTSYFMFSRREVEDSRLASDQAFISFFGVPAPPDQDPWTGFGTESQFVEESRLSFAPTASIGGVLGVYYSDDRNFIGWPPAYFNGLTSLGIGATSDLAYTEVHHTDSKEDALFGEIYYTMLPGLHLTLGGRKFRLEQVASSFYDGLYEGGELVNAPAKNVETGFSPRVSISQEVGGRGNVYASYARGFRPGGVGTVLPSSCDADLAAIGLNPSSPGKYASDRVETYEVGAKQETLNSALFLSAAIFQTRWNEIQQTIFLPTCTFTFWATLARQESGAGSLNSAAIPLDRWNLV